MLVVTNIDGGFGPCFFGQKCRSRENLQNSRGAENGFFPLDSKTYYGFSGVFSGGVT